MKGGCYCCVDMPKAFAAIRKAMHCASSYKPADTDVTSISEADTGIKEAATSIATVFFFC